LGGRNREFTDQTSIGGNGNGLRHSDAQKLTERITRLDAQTVEYIVTVDDAKTYLKPFKCAAPAEG
jgi:hypothetical protein